MEMLFVFVGLIGLPVMAASGAWYRGAYFALALLGGFMAMMFNDLTPPPGAPANYELVGMALFSTSLGTALGGVLGACLYRKPAVKVQG